MIGGTGPVPSFLHFVKICSAGGDFSGLVDSWFDILLQTFVPDIAQSIEDKNHILENFEINTVAECSQICCRDHKFLQSNNFDQSQIIRFSLCRRNRINKVTYKKWCVLLIEQGRRSQISLLWRVPDRW